MTVPHGDISITELPTSPATEVDSVVVRPSQRFRSLNGNTAVVNVPAGSTAANETRITFVNVPGGGANGDLKICKLSETPAYWGRQFSFSVNGGPAISTEANPAFDDPAFWSCREAGSFAQGSVVRVRELIPAGSEIAFIDSDPADCLQDFDTNAGTADLLIGSGTCVVLFDNEPVPPEGNGFLEVCKDAGFNNSDPEVLGVPFEFTIDEQDGSSQDITVLGGQCSAPIVVAAGVARVTEHANPGYTLVDVYTIPADRLLAENLINRTADVEVPTSDNPNDETQVHFVNERDRAQLKICKALGPGSSVLLGRRFDFTASDGSGRPVYRSIIAASNTQCVIVNDFPTGSTVTVEETNQAPYSSVSCDGTSPGLTPGTNRPGTVVIAPGINTITCVNQAIGKLEVCKFITPDAHNQPFTGTRSFVFRIDGGAPFSVRNGTCSPPMYVVPGNHTVTEQADPDFELDRINVTPSDAEVSRNMLARSVTVSVPHAGEFGDEVRVDFYNRVRNAQIKICKKVTPGSEDAFRGKEFDYRVRIEGLGNPPFALPVQGVGVGECKLLVDHTGTPANVPVLLPNGNPRHVDVTEVNMRPPGLAPYDGPGPVPFGQYYVSDLALQGHRNPVITNCQSATYSPTSRHCRLIVSGDGAGAHIRWRLGPNTNTVTFTNTAGNTGVNQTA